MNAHRAETLRNQHAWRRSRTPHNFFAPPKKQRANSSRSSGDDPRTAGFQRALVLYPLLDGGSQNPRP